MRLEGVRRAAQVLLGTVTILGLSVCGGGEWELVPGSETALKSSGSARAARRLYDGAPPVIPHPEFGASCDSCHDGEGLSVEGIGFAPASPHRDTGKAPYTIRCRQCHVPILDSGSFVENRFEGLEQDLRPGARLYPGAPPTIPHQTLMRENCAACHMGPGARAEIITSHPERTRCRQCHVPVTTRRGVLDYGEPSVLDGEGR